MTLLLQAPPRLLVAIPCVLVKIALVLMWVLAAITGMMLMKTGGAVLYDDGTPLSSVRLSLMRDAMSFMRAVRNLSQSSRTALNHALTFDFRFMRWLYPAIILTALCIASCSCLGVPDKWYTISLIAAGLGVLTWIADRRENKTTLKALAAAWADNTEIVGELQPLVSGMRRWAMAKWVAGALCAALLLVLFGAWIACRGWQWHCGC